MKVKEYLEQIRWLDIKINDKISERDSLWSMATKVTPTLSHDKGSGNNVSDKVGNIVAKIVELDEEINKQIDDFIDLKTKIVKQIEKLENDKFSRILYKKYVEYKDLSVIACELHYDYKYILNLHGYALKAFNEQILKVMEQCDIHQ